MGGPDPASTATQPGGPSRDAGGQAAPDAGASVPALLAPLIDAELAAWLEQHHVRPAFRGHQCIPVRIGVPAADGLLCTEPLRGRTKQGSEEWRLWRSNGGRLSLVWEGTRNWEGHVDLRIEIAPGGDSFVLRETKLGACDNIYGQVYEKEEIGDPKETESIRRHCLQRGRYVWKSTRFLRDPHQRPCPPNDPRRLFRPPCTE